MSVAGPADTAEIAAPDEKRGAHDPDVDLTTLPSGLRIVSQHMDHAATVSLGIWIGAGSRDELPHEHGLAHLLEHMAFKGTARRNGAPFWGRAGLPYTPETSSARSFMASSRRRPST